MPGFASVPFSVSLLPEWTSRSYPALPVRSICPVCPLITSLPVPTRAPPKQAISPVVPVLTVRIPPKLFSVPEPEISAAEFAVVLPISKTPFSARTSAMPPLMEAPPDKAREPDRAKDPLPVILLLARLPPSVRVSTAASARTRVPPLAPSDKSPAVVLPPICNTASPVPFKTMC
ncbi:unknown [Akkermansia muciniphila CAG:154]|nr:unknown [Akkermansia muciniphila CAG:154]